MKAQFTSQPVATFQDEINSAYNARWEAYKRQSSGNTLYKKPIVKTHGFKVGLVVCVPVIVAIITLI